MKKSLFFLLAVLISFGCGMAYGFIIRPSLVKKVIEQDDDYRVRLKGYKYISPLLECEEKDNSSDRELNKLETELSSYIKEKISKKELKNASVYYRDLNNGPWIGVNERLDYSPASLLKVPVMMAFLKESENDSSILDEKLVFKKHDNAISQNFAPKIHLKFGEKYTVDQLINQMIVQSDNNALLTLVENIDQLKIQKINTDLGVTTASDSNSSSDYISVKSYASFFRVLYNASYLSPKMSEKALEYLSKEGFYGGISQGVPKGIVIANKFGERKTDEFNQLHDCGIVYTKSPYLVCIMTRGDNFDSLSQVIADISKMIYNNISQPQH